MFETAGSAESRIADENSAAGGASQIDTSRMSPGPTVSLLPGVAWNSSEKSPCLRDSTSALATESVT